MHFRSVSVFNIITTVSILVILIGCTSPFDDNDISNSELESVWQYLKAYCIYQWDDSTSVPDDPFRFSNPQKLMEAIPDTFTGSDGSFGRYTEYITYFIPSLSYYSFPGMSNHPLLGKSTETTPETVTVTLDTLTDSTVIIKITSFHYGEVDYDDHNRLVQWDVTSKTFTDCIRQIKLFPYLIIDLRGNGGGSIDEAVNIIETFIPYGTDFLKARERKYDEDTKTSRTVEHYWTSEGSPFPELTDKKITILMNKRTASSSEILVAALKDCRNATLVGDTSYGKGIGQILLPRRERPTLKITYLQMSGISGRTGVYHHKGIAPDVYIPNVSTSSEALLTAVKIHEPGCTSLQKVLRKRSVSPSPIAGFRIIYE